MVRTEHLVTWLLVMTTGLAALEEEKKAKGLDIATMATDLLARSTTSSQVLSLNLSNLGILLLLKTLIFGAFYLGGGKEYKGRSLDDQADQQELITREEVLFLLAYLVGDTEKDYSCLYRVACQEPSKSKQYISAAKFLIKGAKYFESVIPFDSKYERLVADLQDAVTFGTKYGTCEQRYTCDMDRTSDNDA